jgi:hypothetical protein
LLRQIPHHANLHLFLNAIFSRPIQDLRNLLNTFFEAPRSVKNNSLLAAIRSRGAAGGPRFCRRRVLVPFALSKGTRKKLLIYSYLRLDPKVTKDHPSTGSGCLKKKTRLDYCGDVYFLFADRFYNLSEGFFQMTDCLYQMVKSLYLMAEGFPNFSACIFQTAVVLSTTAACFYQK